MKKLFIAALALLVSAGSANAFEFENEPEPGLSFMGIFGMNISKLQNSGYNAKVGATMGARADYMLPGAHGTYITAGLDWTMKGGKVTAEAEGVPGHDDVTATSKYALHYFEIPIRVGFRYNIIEELGLYGELGPYFAVGVGGKHRLSIDEDGYLVNEAEAAGTYKAFKNTNDVERPTFQRWDAGIGFRIGAEYNHHYNLMLGCDWGLADIYRDKLRDAYFEATEGAYRLPKVKNFNFSITVGYRF